MKTLFVITPMLAAIDSGYIGKFFTLMLYILAALAVWGFGRWIFPKFNAAPIILTIWDALWALAALILLVNFLLGLAGK